MKKKIISLLLSLILCMSVTVPVYADRIDDLKNEQKKNQQKLDEANENIDTLEEEMKGITEEIEVLDDQVVEIIASVSLLEDEIVALEDDIEVATKEYEEAKAEEEEQYEAMKTRLQYLYENGDNSYLNMLFSAQNFSDMLNRADYIEKIHEYDLEMLEKYQKIKKEVEDRKIALEEQHSELETNKQALEEEQAYLEELLEERKEAAEDYESALAKAKQEAAAYKAKIKQQNNEIRRLEEEERRKQQQQNNGGDQSGVIQGANGSASGKEIATYACKFVGNPYVYGGTSLTNGADCSGFTMSVYKAFGYSLPRSSTAQRSAGRGVTYAEAQPGDLICYAGHVGIYIGGGKIVHASTPATGIKYGNATYREILAVRRIVK